MAVMRASGVNFLLALAVICAWLPTCANATGFYGYGVKFPRYGYKWPRKYGYKYPPVFRGGCGYCGPLCPCVSYGRSIVFEQPAQTVTTVTQPGQTVITQQPPVQQQVVQQPVASQPAIQAQPQPGQQTQPVQQPGDAAGQLEGGGESQNGDSQNGDGSQNGEQNGGDQNGGDDQNGDSPGSPISTIEGDDSQPEESNDEAPEVVGKDSGGANITEPETQEDVADEEPDEADDTDVESDADSEEDEGDSSGCQTINEVVQDRDDLGTLRAIIEKVQEDSDTGADFAALLDSSEAELTLFAPTSTAFSEAFEFLEVDLDTVLGDQQTLVTLLLYHIVPNKSLARDDLKSGDVLDTALSTEGTPETLAVNQEGDIVEIRSAGSIAGVLESVPACISTVNIIEAVLLPPQLNPARAQSIEESSEQNPTLPPLDDMTFSDDN